MGLFGSNFIGLDIGSSTIKMVSLKKTGKGIRLINYAIQTVSEEAVEEIDPGMREAVISAALKKMFKAAKVKPGKVVTAVSGDAVIVRYIKLPFMTEDELRNVISYEAEQHIPLSIDQVIIDFHILGEVDEDNQKKLEVLLVAAKDEFIDEHIALLKASKLKPAIIDIDCFAMENAYLNTHSEESGETVALINIGAKITTINVVEDGVSHLTRDFTVAGNHFTKEIQREFNLSFAQAEELKQQQGSITIESDEITLTRMPDKNDQGARISEAVTPILNKMLSEFRRSFDFYENSIKKRPITKVVLSGGGAKLKNIEKFLADKLGLPCVVANPFEGVDILNKNIDEDHLKDNAPMLAVCFGLALRQVA